MNPKRVRVKMCGMTREQDIAHAAGLGVDAIGLIFHPKSTRYISIDQAKRILRQIPVFVDIVAVLVDPTTALVEQIISELPVQWLQFHGNELPTFCAQFNRPYIKAIQAVSTEKIEQLSGAHSQAAAILLDTPSTACHGGTGKLFDWGIIPKKLNKPLILAGGLDANTIRDAVTRCSPYAVDVCTGIESSSGVKDHGKMSQFVNVLWDRE